MTRVLVYDADGFNPYGRELAALLAGACDVVAAVPADTAWLPPGVMCRRILPGNLPASRCRQAGRLARALAVVTWEALARRRVLVVVLTRGGLEDLVLALLARFGASLLVIAHDPTPKFASGALSGWARRVLWGAARTLVAHSPALAAEVRQQSRTRTVAVAHLPFSEWVRSTGAARTAARSPGGGRLLVLGHVRPDKGLDRLPHILDRLPSDRRRSMSLCFAGRGDLGSTLVEISRLVEVTRSPTQTHVEDGELAELLRAADLLLAPYPRVSASGTVVLALSAGLRVVAYDVGALREVVHPTGLVPPADEAAFAATVLKALDGEAGGAVLALTRWRAQAAADWMEVISPQPPATPIAASER